MAQIGIRKLETEILKAQQFIQDLKDNKSYLIITETEIFLISIPFGKIEIRFCNYFNKSKSGNGTITRKRK